MIPNIRLLSQQLANPEFDNPKELVAWMGAIQAQDYTMAKWAVGIRLKTASIRTVEDALVRGEIVRTHVMRPTWHFVAGEDIRWMLKLSARRIKRAYDSYSKGLSMEITEGLYTQSNNLLEKILSGNNSLTRQEIGLEFNKAGIIVDNSRMNQFLSRARLEGVVCSGVDKGKQPTYALLEERVAPVRELHKEEALALLAIRYFRSHSPASLNDFVWWSGLPVTEARHAIGLIEAELITDTFASLKLYVHESFTTVVQSPDRLHFLPSYDEYLISYKDRTAVLELRHHSKAFNTWGIFYPVILYNGLVAGNWSKSLKKGSLILETSFFEQNPGISKEQIKLAEERYRAFVL